MEILGIGFGPVWGASGIQGFFGESYPYHTLLSVLPGFNFTGMTFVAKTTTLEPRKGNMELAKNGISPKKLFPDCIKVKWFKGAALNSVGLSGPGAEELFDDWRWQRRTSPFMLSFMSVAAKPEQRIAEAKEFFTLLQARKYEFKGQFGLQINFSCPNVGLDPDELAKEVFAVLDMAGMLKIPIVPKFNTETPVELVAQIAKHENCHALCVSNTIPWNNIPKEYRLRVFGSTTSPLTKYGGGGLSGEFLMRKTFSWVYNAKQAGIKIPINAGGGILKPQDIHDLKEAGADSIFLGSVAFLRPWRIKDLIETAHSVFS